MLNFVEICSGQPQDEAVLGQFGDVPFQSHMMLDFMLFVSQPLTFVLLIFISLLSLHHIFLVLVVASYFPHGSSVSGIVGK